MEPGTTQRSQTIYGRLSYVLNHILFLMRDNPVVLMKYLGYAFKRTATYPMRKIREDVRNTYADKRYHAITNNKQEVILGILGNKMILPVTDEGLSRDLVVDGIREASSVKVLQRELKEDMNVLDLGANLGYYLLMEARILSRGKGKAWAIEPNPEAVKYIKRNLECNNYSGIPVFTLAISDKPGIAPFYISKQWNCSRFIKGDPSDIVKEIPMTLETIDNLFGNRKLEPFGYGTYGQRLDFIRMDVEGYEFNILKGAVKTIKNNPGIAIFFEFHAQFFTTPQRKEFIRFLKENNLHVKYFFGGDDEDPQPYPPSSNKGYQDIKNAMFTTYYLYLTHNPSLEHKT